MSDLVLRLARPGEDARIADFINQNFDMRLPLINRADFYQFYYAHTPGAAPQFALAEQDGEVVLEQSSQIDDIHTLVMLDEELAQMRKTCAAIMGFVHNHPEQLPRVRRYREYYMPTTRKLLNTALGLGESATQNAQEIRRDIVGILHTLNTAYEKLYDTLLQDVSMDVSTEIDTLEAMLNQDGLTHDFAADFGAK